MAETPEGSRLLTAAFVPDAKPDLGADRSVQYVKGGYSKILTESLKVKQILQAS